MHTEMFQLCGYVPVIRSYQCSHKKNYVQRRISLGRPSKHDDDHDSGQTTTGFIIILPTISQLTAAKLVNSSCQFSLPICCNHSPHRERERECGNHSPDKSS